MFNTIFTKIFGSRNERLIKKMRKTVERINAFEAEMESLSDADLASRTDIFRKRIADGTSLDELLPEAFAVVREASRRSLALRHYDVQMIGGMVLHQGKISEMKTGEGKTLVATLAAYLNALSGDGVHVVTVNDYLARRDADWMAPLYNFLGLTVGVVVPNQTREEKAAAYAADITYGTNNEYGFDYLRDNMAFLPEERFQRGVNFAIVDEVDSILIDEARTPLIISGPTDDNPELYHKINRLIPRLTPQQEEDGPGDFSIDEKQKQIHLTEDGMANVEQILESEGLLAAEQSLYDPQNLALVHHLNAALRAHHLFALDVDYIVRDKEVVIVDEFTGRTLAGRRWSDGLHQAVEAKEGVPVQHENQTLASITFQNYFRLYKKLSGMTGTADTEAYEFQTIYGLEVVVIPTHKPMVRKDFGDVVFLTAKEKYDAILEDILDCNQRGQPALVGTTSIETSELLAHLLKKNGVKHEVLNAKHHEREAQIVAEAGMPGRVTIATNMAGRGTDIVLGGNLEAELKALPDGQPEADIDARRSAWAERHNQVLKAGGLHIIGTERHESRRIDNQLRGRSGRQGDAGSSRFYLSLEDNLMRIFAPERMKGIMQRFGMQAGEAIEHPWVSRAIENAQRKVEAHNFDIRKNLLEFDDVANDQRIVVYGQRAELMESEQISDTITQIREDVLSDMMARFIPPDSIDEQWDVPGLEKALVDEYGIHFPLRRWLDDESELDEPGLRKKLLEEVGHFFAEREALIGSEPMRQLEKRIMLYVLDTRWKEHLANMDYLRQWIHLRGYAQKQPKQEYKRESFEMFERLLDDIRTDVIKLLARVQIRDESDVSAVAPTRTRQRNLQYQHDAAPGSADSDEPEQHQPFVRDGEKIGRNDPCPCGSGQKYKRCHGRVA